MTQHRAQLSLPHQHSVQHCGVHRGQTVLLAVSPRGSPPCSFPLCRDMSPCTGDPQGPWYLVATGAGAAVETKGIIVAGALVLTGVGEAGVALGLYAQGRWACGTGGTKIARDIVQRVMERCPFVGTNMGSGLQPQLGAEPAQPMSR